MKLAWATDIHLDFLDEPGVARFCDGVSEAGPDGVLVCGDIAQARSVEAALRTMADRIRKPIWFVLGNHDYYGDSIAAVRDRVSAEFSEGPAVWLGAVDLVELTPRTALVGHDGWGDARLGDHERSEVLLTDFFVIAELGGGGRLDLDRGRLNGALRRLGDESAAHLRRVLPDALDRFEHVLVLTHVPPFREAAWHEGRLSDDDYLPYFACKATGDVIAEEASRRADRRVTVLCGHTHSGGECRPLPNLHVITGAARYGRPSIQRPLIEV